MSGRDLGTLLTVAGLLFTMALAWQKSQDARQALERRIEVLESVVVSEHPQYSAMLFPK